LFAWRGGEGSWVVHQTWQYSATEMERMMKVQEVLLKAMVKKITWWAAAEIIGVSDRTMRRWRERLERDGYAGLADRRKRKASAQRIPLATVEEVLALCKETYALNIRHFHEKLRDELANELSYTWIQKALQGAGVAAAPAVAWDAAAHRWQQTSVAERRSLARSDPDPGRLPPRRSITRRWISSVRRQGGCA
jgi:transposase